MLIQWQDHMFLTQEYMVNKGGVPMASRIMNADIFDKINGIYEALPNGDLKKMIIKLEDNVKQQNKNNNSLDSIKRGLNDVE